GYLPDFAGMQRFEGAIVHPQAWPADLDYAGKRVVVIGSGATAVTLVPALAQDARHVTMLQRSPSYFVSVPARNPITDVLRAVLPAGYSGRTIRWLMALGTQGFFQLSKRHPALVRRVLRKGVER